MRKAIIALALFSAAALLSALPGQGMGIDPQIILKAAPTAADKTPAELTIGERIAIASAVSVAQQEKAYVRTAAVASFLIPGAGQIRTGDYGGAAIHFGAQAVILGGSVVALWYLAPANLLNFTGTMKERHAAVSAYMTKDRIGEILPAMGVMAGAAALSLVDRVVAAEAAKKRAEANLASGQVSFEPALFMAGGMPGFGMKFHLR
jgi:hypothetical protein